MALRDSENIREAAVLRVFGDASQAFDMRGLSADERRWRRFVLVWMLRRIAGSDIYNPESGWHSHVCGIPRETIIALISNIDAWEQLLAEGHLLHDRCCNQDLVENEHATATRTHGSMARISEVLLGWWKTDFIEAERLKGKAVAGYAQKARSRVQYFLRELVRYGAAYVQGVPLAIAKFHERDDKALAERLKDCEQRANRSARECDRARTIHSLHAGGGAASKVVKKEELTD